MASTGKKKLVAVTLRLPVGVLDRVKERATVEGVSEAAWLRDAIIDRVEDRSLRSDWRTDMGLLMESIVKTIREEVKKNVKAAIANRDRGAGQDNDPDPGA